MKNEDELISKINSVLKLFNNGIIEKLNEISAKITIIEERIEKLENKLK